MAISVETFSGLVSGIQKSALSPSRWQATLQRLVSTVGCSSAGLIFQQRDLRRFNSVSVGVDPQAVAAYNAYYGRIDPVAAGMEQAPAGVVRRIGEVVPLPKLQRTEIYNDWALRYEHPDGLFVSVLRRAAGNCTLCLSHDGRIDLFERPHVLRLARMLVPHLQQALCMQAKLAEIEATRDIALEALDTARHGVVLAAPNGMVLFANAAAVDIFEQHDGLSLDARRLYAALANENTRLHRLLGQAGYGDPNGLRSGGSLAVSRPSGHRPLAVHVLPLDAGDHSSTCANARVLLLIADPDHDHKPQASTLRQLYGLTEAEAAVAVRITRCNGLRSVAHELSVSLPTARTHLQRVFEKTGTHRQAELVRLLLEL